MDFFPSFYSLSAITIDILLLQLGKKSLLQCNMKTLRITFIDKFRVDIKIQSGI